MAVQASSLAIIVQLCDASFPVGSFAHSFGFEAAKETKALSRGGVPEFLARTLQQQAKLTLPLLRLTWRMLDSSAEVEALLSLNGFISATLANGPAIRASQRQGVALARLAIEIFPSSAALLTPLWERGVKAPSDAPHLPCVLAVLCHAQGILVEEADGILMYTTLRDCVSAAVRLDLLGPIEGAKLTATYSQLLRRLAEGEHVETAQMQIRVSGGSWPSGGFQDGWDQRVPRVDWPETFAAGFARQCDPVLDITQGQHDTLYSRLFLS